MVWQEKFESLKLAVWASSPGTLFQALPLGHARELFGGNGILIEHDIARFVADAEAIYSYEGTKEINTLIVGRAITGQSAFV